ncbi:hypothetical protein [Flavobacterium cellulosilyticum]|uniref:Uncharacterized protein n=1 Tax=Flavobacterium cellulosilyticum TaxID=2541731 RepID=A0A4R5CLJ2_9FLAO|nr:hypothetical protein [Flavobacterium cellulosilyticum]TDD98342.1 hypothetical protein E0F76_04160 [Flavobacterium cellulosilyticum]
MNQLTKRNRNTKINTFFMMIVFMLLLNSSIFAQVASENNSGSVATIEKSEIVNSNIEMNAMKQQPTSGDSNMNFILWFMGSKQSPNSSVMPRGTSAKQQFITSGTEPNRLLIKAFLKKAVNFESSIV